MGNVSPWLPGPGRSMSAPGGGCRPLSWRRKPRHQGSVVGCHRLPPASVKNQLGRISDVSTGVARGELRAPSCTPLRGFTQGSVAVCHHSLGRPRRPQHRYNPKTVMPRHANRARGAHFQTGHLAVPGQLCATPALPASVSPSLRWGLAGPQPLSPAASETPSEPVPVASGLEAVQQERNSHRVAAFLFPPLSACVCIYINKKKKK